VIDLINKKRAGQTITPKARPAAGNVVNLIDALRASIGKEQGSKPAKKAEGGRRAEGNAAADRRRSPRRRLKEDHFADASAKSA
jgi:DNA end-binding protein Ku